MKKLNKILALLFFAVTIFCAIYFKDIKILSFLVFIVFLFIFKLNPYITFICLLYGFLGIFLGFLLHLYKITSWYDTFTHYLYLQYLLFGKLLNLLLIIFFHQICNVWLQELMIQ